MLHEHGRRERHLLSGMGIQMLVIAFMVFTYTQAARYRNSQRNFYLMTREQLVSAKQEVESRGALDLSGLESRMSQVQNSLPRAEALSDWAKELETLAREEFGFRQVSARVGPLERIVAQGTEKGSLQIPLYLVELKATATSRNVAGFPAALSPSKENLLSPLETMELAASPAGEPLPVTVHLRWLAATSPSGEWKSSSVSPPAASASWGPREEIFLPSP